MKDKFCDLCAAKGVKKKLIHCYVNFDEGMLLCENTSCVYPFGSSDVSSLLINKKAASHSVEKTRKKPKIPEAGNVESLDGTFTKGLSPGLYWSNSDSLCWLDAVMTVLVNNRCLQLCLGKLKPKESILQKLFTKFTQAQRYGLQKRGQVLLDEARSEVFEFLKSKMKCELGVNDSPVVSLNVLLKENPQINEKFMQEYRWNFKCVSCGYVQVNSYKKSIVTFPNTSPDFCMPSASFLRPCYECKLPDQRSTLEFQQMPPCVSVHFVEGVNNKEFLKSRFVCQGKEYELCQIIQYKRNPDHFVSWVRNVNGTQWAEVDDIKDEVCEWRDGLPLVPLNEIHIALWERTSLYQKNLTTTKACETITARKKHVPSQRLVDNNQDVCIPTRTRNLKDPPLLRRKVDGHPFAFRTCTGNVGCAVNKIAAVNKEVKKLNMNDKTGETFALVENKEHSKENVDCKRKNDADNFEPYIPRKKRAIDGEATDANSDVSGNCIGDISIPGQDTVCSRDEHVGKSTNFLPWQDGISVSLKGKQKQCVVGDNQSDSGYSSPGSNSSCTSLTMPCLAEEVPGLDEFLGSLNSLDLPDIVNSARCVTNEDVCKLTVSTGECVENLNIDDLLEEIFPDEQLQTEKSKTISDIIDDIMPSIPFGMCTDLDNYLADI